MSSSHRTLAQLYAGGFGAVLLLTGIIGFFVDSSFSTPPTGEELIVFDVNGWHNVVHVLSGVAGLVLARTAAGGRAFALGFGVIYGVVTLWGLIAGDSVLGIVAVNGADNLLHLAIAVTGIVAGLASRPEPAPRSPIAAT